MGNWCKTKEIYVISHGEWSDPELYANGFTANYWDVEEMVVHWMKEENLDWEDDNVFGKFVRNHESEIIEYIEENGEEEGDDEDAA